MSMGGRAKSRRFRLCGSMTLHAEGSVSSAGHLRSYVAFIRSSQFVESLSEDAKQRGDSARACSRTRCRSFERIFREFDLLVGTQCFEPIESSISIQTWAQFMRPATRPPMATVSRTVARRVTEWSGDEVTARPSQSRSRPGRTSANPERRLGSVTRVTESAPKLVPKL